MKLEEAQPDMPVMYVKKPGTALGKNEFERGIISSKNDTYVFVKFNSTVAKLGWNGTTAQACKAEDLVAI